VREIVFDIENVDDVVSVPEKLLDALRECDEL
jgi:hypothetical protein